MMIDLMRGFTIPAAYAVLPPLMASDRATALLLAIGLQESGFRARRQAHGPARGFWQFEIAGVRAVLEHERTQVPIAKALMALGYDYMLEAEAIQPILEHNDVLAACVARCLLWTSTAALPAIYESAGAWRAYVEAWRPGKPHRAAWDPLYAHAWAITTTPEGTTT